jgi:hypothetical protein
MDLGEMGWCGVDRICLAQDRERRRALVNSVLNFWVPYNARKLSSDFKPCGLPSSVQLHGVN